MEKPTLRETIIYGGAFNPPTLAHQAILQACVDYAEPRAADVWLLPSASRRDKSIDVAYEKRLAYCEALVRDVVSKAVDIDIKTLELDSANPTETHVTAQQLCVQHPDRSFTWVFGADSVTTMDQWSHGTWLRENLNMLVVERPGYAAQVLGVRATRLVIESIEVSSTELRRRIEAGESYDELVGSSVARLLRSNRRRVIC